jgi:Tfp pilus assembly protein PilO
VKPVKPPKLRLDSLATFLNSRNAREKYLLIALFGVFLLVLDYFLWLAPLFKTYGEAAPKIAPLREEVRVLKEDHKNKDAIQKRWEEVKLELAEKDKMFIAPNETPALLENLSKQAQRTGVKITSLEPFDGPKAAGPTRISYTPLPIQMKAAAGTHEFGALLSALETGSTFFKVKDLRIASNPLNERKHVIELSMEAFKREK